MTDVIRQLVTGDDKAPETWCGTAEVVDLSTPPTADGRLTVGVSWGGAFVAATYLRSYTPALGHNVLFLRDGTSLVVLGAVATT